jgi:hypothetical protein
VGTTPATWTPSLSASTPEQYVKQIVQCDQTMYAVGTETDITQAGTRYVRGNGFAFSATDGTPTVWDPKTNGEIRAIALSPDCSVAFIGGSFTTLDGQPAQHLAAVNASTGALLPMGLAANYGVDSLAYLNDRLLVGGSFTTLNGVGRSRFGSIDPTTGQVTDYANVSITGEYTGTYGRVYRMQPSHDGTRLLIEGVFTAIDGQPRRQVAVLDLGDTVTLDGWTSPEFVRHCRPIYAYYTRDAAWSPDDQTIYTVTTGHKPPHGAGSGWTGPRAGPCDAVMAFPSTPQPQHHTWVNYTGCDSLLAVTADDTFVYVSGHERWLNNGQACEEAGPGAVARPGISSVTVTGGRASQWNPTRDRGHGGDRLLLTDAGLWIASDNFDGSSQHCGGQPNHGGICFLPREA